MDLIAHLAPISNQGVKDAGMKETGKLIWPKRKRFYCTPGQHAKWLECQLGNIRVSVSITVKGMYLGFRFPGPGGRQLIVLFLSSFYLSLPSILSKINRKNILQWVLTKLKMVYRQLNIYIWDPQVLYKIHKSHTFIYYASIPLNYGA